MLVKRREGGNRFGDQTRQTRPRTAALLNSRYGRRLPASSQPRPLGRRLVLFVPIKLPEPFQLHQFHVAVVKRHVDRPRKLVLRSMIGRHPLRSGTMTRDRQGAHTPVRAAQIIACDQVRRRNINRPGRHPPEPHAIGKHRCARGLPNLFFTAKRRLRQRTIIRRRPPVTPSA